MLDLAGENALEPPLLSSIKRARADCRAMMLARRWS